MRVYQVRFVPQSNATQLTVWEAIARSNVAGVFVERERAEAFQLMMNKENKDHRFQYLLDVMEVGEDLWSLSGQ